MYEIDAIHVHSPGALRIFFFDHSKSLFVGTHLIQRKSLIEGKREETTMDSADEKSHTHQRERQERERPSIVYPGYYHTRSWISQIFFVSVEGSVMDVIQTLSKWTGLLDCRIEVIRHKNKYKRMVVDLLLKEMNH
jgi:hypothetical protein